MDNEIRRQEIHYTIVENAAIEDKRLNVYELATYLILSYHADNKTGKSFPSYDRIADEVHISKSSAIKAIKGLIEKGYVSKEIRVIEGKQENTSNMYTLITQYQKKDGGVSSTQCSVPDTPGSASETPQGGVPKTQGSVPDTPELYSSNYTNLSELNSPNNGSGKIMEFGKEPRLNLDKIIDEWNRIDVCNSDKMKALCFMNSEVQRNIRLYGEDVVIQAIRNYGKIFHDPKSNYHHKHYLWRFISEMKVDFFTDAVDPFYKHYSHDSKESEDERRHNAFVDAL